MGTGALIRGGVVVLALAPALAWYATPALPLLGAVVAVVAIAAALHGLGRLVGAVAGDDEAPVALVIAWGLAAYLALAGTLAGGGAFDASAQRIVAVVGTAAGAVWGGRRSDAVRGWRPWRWRPSLATLAPALALTLVALHVLGEAGTTAGRFFDGEVYHLGPLARLRSTGELGDAVGMPRTSGLGGNVLLSALTVAFDHTRAAHAIDALGLALTVALGFGAARPGPMRLVALFTLVVLASATPVYPADLAPRWTVVALMFALYQSLARLEPTAPRPWGAVAIAGALAGLWHGGLGVVVVIAIHLLHAAPTGVIRRRLAAGITVTLVLALGGLLIAAALAFGREPARDEWLDVIGHGVGARVAMWSAIAAVAYAVSMLALRDLDDRALATTVTAACAAAAAAGLLSPSIAVAWQVFQPFGIAVLLLLIAPALALPWSPVRGPHPTTAVTMVLAILTLATLRFPVGVPRISWEDRLIHLVDGAHALVHVPRRRDLDEAADLAAAQADIPAGARVGIWVERADLIDFRRGELIDLRSAATTACVDRIPLSTRTFERRPRACVLLDALLPRLDLDYLLVSPSALPRPDAWFDRPRCFGLAPRDCMDPITRFVGRTRMLAPGPLLLLDLRPRS